MFRLKICLRTGINILVQPLIMKPVMSSTPTDSDGLRPLIRVTSKTSESETGAKDKNLDDDERAGKITGQGLLYTD
jgi:hypothetical protein